MGMESCLEPGYFSSNSAEDCDQLVVCASEMKGHAIDDLFEKLTDPDPVSKCTYTEDDMEMYTRSSNTQQGVNLFRYIEEPDHLLRCPSQLRAMETFTFPLYAVDNIV